MSQVQMTVGVESKTCFPSKETAALGMPVVEVYVDQQTGNLSYRLSPIKPEPIPKGVFHIET